MNRHKNSKAVTRTTRRTGSSVASDEVLDESVVKDVKLNVSENRRITDNVLTYSIEPDSEFLLDLASSVRDDGLPPIIMHSSKIEYSHFDFNALLSVEQEEPKDAISVGTTVHKNDVEVSIL